MCHPRRRGEWNEPLRAGDHLNFFMLSMCYVYVMTNQLRGTLYTGVTNDLVGRVWQHRNDVIDGFTMRYGLHLLVYFESTEDVREAIRREKRLKRRNREWKIAMIEKSNPEWKDLYETITEDGCPLKAGMTEIERASLGEGEHDKKKAGLAKKRSCRPREGRGFC